MWVDYAASQAYVDNLSKVNTDRQFISDNGIPNLLILKDLYGQIKMLMRLKSDVLGRQTWEFSCLALGIYCDGSKYKSLTVGGLIGVDITRNEVTSAIVNKITEGYGADVRNITGESWFSILEGNRAIFIFTTVKNSN